VKDADSTPEKPENADDMSLADLLGAGGGQAEEDSPRRVEHRDDEPDSGMVNLAKMVAASSVDVAKTTSIAPPPPAYAEQSGVRPMPTADPSGMIPTQMGQPAAPAPAPKSNGAIYALIAVVVVAAAGIGIFLATRGGGDEQSASDQATLDKAAEMMKALEAKAEADRKAAAEERAMLMAKLEEMSKAADGTGAVSAEEQAKMDAVKAQIEEAKAKEEAASQKVAEAAAEKPKKESSSQSSGSSSSAKKESSSSKSESTAKAEKSSTAEKKPEPAAKTGGSTEELDSLLGAKKEEPKAAAAEKPASDLPKQLSKDQVKAGMAPVQAKAQAMCAKKSTGTVTVQLVISGEGKVKSATPTGIWANNDAGKCVSMLARTAKFPKFADPTMTVSSYPIVLQ
jgi:chemotaxis protein histidine kinase CheA